MNDLIAHSSFVSQQQPDALKGGFTPGSRTLLASLTALLLLGQTVRAEEVAAPAAPNCAKYDQYNYRGSESPFPSNCESIAPELGGFRETLFNSGWNAQLILTTGLTYDLKSHDRETQVYSGQRPSSTSTGSLLINHDLGRYGLPAGSLFTLGGSFAYSSFRGDGLREGFISQLSARVPFYDDRVIVQVGYFSLAGQFYGTLLGNNIAASTLGPSSGLLAQTGAQGFKPSPALDIRLYSEDKRFYNHIGVARSISPAGLFPDADDNRSGLRFNTKDARAVVIDEVGYRVEAGPDQKKIWLRGGVVYNNSQYARLDEPGEKTTNHGAYIVGDLQLTQPSSSLPYKGWYVNAYINEGRDNVNYLPGAFGGSLYNLGPFESRPYDLFAIGASKNEYSRYARRNAGDAGLDYADASTNISVSYAYRVSRGIYLQTALIHTDNPTFAPRRDSSVNAYTTLVLVF
ncbi:carbohydrate porin [Pseudomonas sp. SDO524_S393]